MIEYRTTIKNAYKDYERQIQATGVLYLATKNISKNQFNVYGTKLDTNVTTSIDYLRQLIVQLDSSIGTSLARVTIKVTLKPNTNYVLTTKFQRDNVEMSSGLFGVRATATGGNWLRSTDIPRQTSATLSVSFNSGSYTEAYVWFYVKSNINIEAVTTRYVFSETMLVEGTEAIPYEKYGTYVNNYKQFYLTEENNCKILSFYINEKTDVYYTSLPYNTMTIEVDNEKGYFTDYDDDSIVNKLNSDCYLILYLKINDTQPMQCRRMKFDKISYSDYEKAKLTFKSTRAFLKNLPLRDYLKDFNVTEWGLTRLRQYMWENYEIDVRYNGNNRTVINSFNFRTSSIENMILEAGTYQGTLERSVLVLDDYMNYLRFKTWGTTAEEKITKDYELSKPIVKRENSYTGVKHYDLTNSSSYYTSSSETYHRTIAGTLSSVKEVIIYRDNNYKLNELTINDMTASSGITLEVETNTNYNIVMLTIEGSIGQEYTITINKANIKKRTIDNIVEKNIGATSDTSKILTITESSPLMPNYYNLILSEKKIKSYVEAEIMALPYLELGDTIEVETDNANVIITISEIDMKFDGGLTETIKGYELGWDALYPSDTLYPSDNLYPNTPIN